MTSVELREERAGIVAQARQITDKAAEEKRELTPEENEAFDKHMEDVDKLKVKIDKLEKLEDVEADLDAPGERASKPLDGEERSRKQAEARGERGEARIKEDFRHFMLTGEVRESLRPEARLAAELRDTIIGTDAKGGYLVAPRQMTNDLVKAIDDQVFIRRLAIVTQVREAKKLGIRKLTARMADADWTTEVGAVTEDTTMAFGLRELEPFLLTKLAKASIRTLLLASDAQSIIQDELAYKFSITEEKAFMTGDGSSKPLGVFTASASGISTGRDVVAGTTTAFTADGLIDVKYSLKAAYQNSPSLAWIFHRDAVKAARKLKDGDNQYIWAPGLSAGEPDSILGAPFYMSEYAPATFTAGLYVGIIGDFRYYRIAELQSLMIQRLVELYAATNEVGFIGRRWVDGAPILEEAFARVKLAAS